MKRLRSPILASVLVLTPIVLFAAAPAARADIPPTCDETPVASLITCAAADVGKPCQGAGQCYAVSCSVTTPGAATTILQVRRLPDRADHDQRHLLDDQHRHRLRRRGHLHGPQQLVHPRGRELQVRLRDARGRPADRPADG